MNPKPVACPPVMVPAELTSLGAWLRDVEKQLDRDYPRYGPPEGAQPFPGLGPAIQRLMTAAAAVNGLLHHHGLLDEERNDR